MINLFLKAKHWQLFILLFAVPVVFQMVMMGVIISDAITTRNAEPTFMFGYINFFIAMMVIYLFGLMGWFGSISIGLQKKLPSNVKMRVNQFKFFFLVPVFYISLILIGISLLTNNDESIFEAITPNILGTIFVIIIPLHLFSMFCMFHTIFFTAKTLKSAELQREALLGDYIVEFLLLWFYPVGIWILQPKVNKLTKKEKLIEIE